MHMLIYNLASFMDCVHFKYWVLNIAFFCIYSTFCPLYLCHSFETFAFIILHFVIYFYQNCCTCKNIFLAFWTFIIIWYILQRWGAGGAKGCLGALPQLPSLKVNFDLRYNCIWFLYLFYTFDLYSIGALPQLPPVKVNFDLN